MKKLVEIKKELDDQFGDFNEHFSSMNKNAIDQQRIIYKYLMEIFANFYPNKKGRSAIAVGSMSPHEVEELANHFDDLTIHNLYGLCFVKMAENKTKANFNLSFGPPEIASSYKKDVDFILSIHTLNFFDDAKAVVSTMAKTLCPGGRLCLAVQNAKSASRRLAKTMGYIEDYDILSPQELSWRQKRFLDMDGLRKLVKGAGLKELTSGGAFFKIHTEGQLNQLAESGQASEAYINALMKLGEAYPELCQTVYIVAEKV